MGGSFFIFYFAKTLKVSLYDYKFFLKIGPLFVDIIKLRSRLQVIFLLALPDLTLLLVVSLFEWFRFHI